MYIDYFPNLGSIPGVFGTVFLDPAQIQLTDLTRSTIVPMLNCPSDAPRPDLSPWSSRSISNYMPCLGPVSMPNPPAGNLAAYTGISPYSGVAGGVFPGWFGDATSQWGDSWAITGGVECPGAFAHVDWAANLRDVTDGTENVIAMGEVRPMCAELDGNDGYWDPFNSNLNNTIPPINFPHCTTVMYNSDGLIEPLAPGFATYNQVGFVALIPSQYGFRSRHPAGAQFVYCDGSVHFLNEFIAYDAYQRLGDRRDAHPVTSIDP
jgi:prepilin-type processing-associated H-X9-DG protein